MLFQEHLLAPLKDWLFAGIGSCLVLVLLNFMGFRFLMIKYPYIPSVIFCVIVDREFFSEPNNLKYEYLGLLDL